MLASQDVHACAMSAHRLVSRRGLFGWLTKNGWLASGWLVASKRAAQRSSSAP
jgi:hypothetical protein